uniref:G-protein coupled receptors family 1 profile domain-containing protein n=1 Tax=Romanomermis culicivorax TaxID=13658 RepID=A0A915KTX0_ROMCU
MKYQSLESLKKLEKFFASTNKSLIGSGREDSEHTFGVVLCACGLAAALANALILCIVSKHLKSKNVLFIIIANFALIDEFKALCGIYIGWTYLTSAISNISSPLRYYKTLQVSLFILYFGNICSVLNLILAVINELLYIKLPLQYPKVVSKGRVVSAVVLIWVAGLGFSLSKSLHGGRDSSTIMVNLNFSYAINDTVTRKDMYKRPTDGAVTDIYALILVAVLIICLIIVGATYLCLYCTIRRANFFHKESVRSKVSRGSLSLTNTESPDLLVTINNHHSSLQRRVSSKYKCGRRSYDSQTQTNFSWTTNHNGSLSERPSFRDPHPSICTTVINRHKPRRNSRLLKRHKCIIVILSVCGLYIVYLGIYFFLQLFHVIHIVKGLEQSKLAERYITNLILRSMFVLQASLNPLIFFRIKSFRQSFWKFFSNIVHCCKRSSPSMPKMSRPSVADFSVPPLS